MNDLISKLSEIRSDYNCFDEDGEPYYRALSEAIRILSQRADGDTISRQAAIDRINKQREHLQPDIYPQDKIGDATYRICAEFIARLPSAQPKIIRCKNCRWNDGTCYCEFHYRDVKADDYCSWAERRTDE